MGKKRHKSYSKEAREALDKIEYYHKYGGRHGYSQAEPYFTKLGKCLTKSVMNQAGDAYSIQEMHRRGGQLMDEMEKVQNETPPGSPPASP